MFHIQTVFSFSDSGYDTLGNVYTVDLGEFRIWFFLHIKLICVAVALSLLAIKLHN